MWEAFLSSFIISHMEICYFFGHHFSDISYVWKSEMETLQILDAPYNVQFELPSEYCYETILY